MGLIKVLATGCDYSDIQETLAGSKGKDGEKGGADRGQSMVELTTLRRSMDSFLTTTPSPLSSLNMPAMSSQDKPQTCPGWTSGFRRKEKQIYLLTSTDSMRENFAPRRGQVSPLALWPG